MRKIIPSLFILLLSVSAVFSQKDSVSNPPDTTGGSEYEIFLPVDPSAPEDPLKIKIEFDYKEFLKLKYKDTSLNADLSVYDADKLLYSSPVKISTRGESRKKICFFPPFALDFKKSSPGSQYNEDMGKLKFVTQCKNNKIGEQYLLKEYICYKLLNLLTDYSYRVRLVQIEFNDNAGKIKPYINYGFIVETNEHIGERILAYPIEVKGVRMKQTDFDNAHLMTVYQYMIGNTDWDVPSLHNIRLFKLKDYNKINPVAITYDFDYAGLVNADYAIPQERFGTTSVRERIYMGYCISAQAFQPVFQKFLDNEQNFYNLINNFTYLDKFNKGDMVNYLEDFFEIIKNARMTQDYIINRCVNEP
jgi:hypothetical protein